MPRAYIDYLVMKEMGWSYQDLQECPAEVVANIIRYLNTENKYYKQKAR